ncbi:MAG: hypothetical protein BWK80_10655 [Desulfobacteraceae bacterium IS3]|jgi:hypothetical protein|nr:MAG: hypothetical protein BWK80_10655 [Desulfobacteraceae bacterium IS3]HAO19039.1 hypothetical protein [Desulfobacteraceae bacterium]
MNINYQEEIRKNEKHLRDTISRMKEIHLDFIAETTNFMRRWYMKVTEQKVKTETDLTKKLGVQKLSQLKNDLNLLQQKTPDIIREFADTEDLWWHRKQPEAIIPNFSESMEIALRLIAGKLAPVLEKFGYITTNPQDPSFWREWDKFGINHPPNARPYYPHHLDWSEKMQELIREYDELMKDGVEYAVELKRLKETQSRMEAEDLWNKA